MVLIFLMVTTTFKKLEPALQLALPKAKEAKIGSDKTRSFLVMVTTNFPYLYYEKQPVTLAELQKQMLVAVAEDPELKVSIKADKKSPFGEVIKIIDLARQANVGSIDAVTEKADTFKP